MPLDATCPHCASSYSLRPTLAGKTVECAFCGDSFRVPTSSAPPPVPASPVPPAPVIAPAIPPRPRPAVKTFYEPPPQRIIYVEPPARRQPLDLENPYTYVIAASVILFLLFAFIAISDFLRARPSASTPNGTASASNLPSSQTPPAAAAPAFPPLPDASHPAPGISLFRVSFPTGAPSTQTMSLCLFLPDQPKSPLPCVFVAPAGTPLVVGSTIDPNDQAPELYPYLQAGFAACTYSLDGPIPEHPTYQQLLDGYDKFLTAQFGLLNARRAMDFVAARAPSIDPDRFLVAGHSSAATLALLLAAGEPRVKAVAAYCPCLDIMEHNQPLVTFLAGHRSNVQSIVNRYSPTNLAQNMTGAPLLLFGSRQDQVVSIAHYPAFQAAINDAGGQASLTLAPSGDHYHAMVDSGIPQGIKFFNHVLASMP